MAYMVVTLDVSKLSGWLNADAFCRVGGRCYEAKRGAGKEMRRGPWGNRFAGEVPTGDWAQGTRGRT
eukprot:scaffold27099_cov53-Phaeocystis_antarctica.AAC.2